METQNQQLAAEVVRQRPVDKGLAAMACQRTPIAEGHLVAARLFFGVILILQKDL